LRSGVITRLLAAEASLRQGPERWRLAIFDAWRPVAVQRFMVAQATAEECRARGLDPAAPGPGLVEVEAAVARFWAPPSLDPATPLPWLHGPCGLDVGGETPAEVALSVCAEIQAVFAGQRGGFLREKRRGIHERAPAEETP
jgi:D-alanyl-D-alanine dipeptidase